MTETIEFDKRSVTYSLSLKDNDELLYSLRHRWNDERTVNHTFYFGVPDDKPRLVLKSWQYEYTECPDVKPETKFAPDYEIKIHHELPLDKDNINIAEYPALIRATISEGYNLSGWADGFYPVRVTLHEYNVDEQGLLIPIGSCQEIIENNIGRPGIGVRADYMQWNLPSEEKLRGLLLENLRNHPLGRIYEIGERLIAEECRLAEIGTLDVGPACDAIKRSHWNLNPHIVLANGLLRELSRTENAWQVSAHPSM